jgi:hypothetical protein
MNANENDGFLGQGSILATYPSGKTMKGKGKLYFGVLPGSNEACPMMIVGVFWFSVNWKRGPVE